MNKLFSILNRTVLVMGLLVALTPCGLCHGPAMSQTSACPMAHMGNMKCCQGHQAHNPLCKIMDQSTVSLSMAQAPAAAPAVVMGKVYQPSFLTAAPVDVILTVVESPPRSSPVLRI